MKRELCCNNGFLTERALKGEGALERALKGGGWFLERRLQWDRSFKRESFTEFAVKMGAFEEKALVD